MIIIGAVIGGFTNHLAIKMLFRPYRALYIGKWRIPFTPGLIPKRRDELAKQMGNMVVGHLLTPEGIQKKLSQSEFKSDVTLLAQNEISKLLETEKTLEEVMEQLQFRDGTVKLKRQIDIFIEKTYERLSLKYHDQPIKTVIPLEVQEKIIMKVPIISQYILDKGIEYFSSIEGKARIQRMFDDFLKERGMLGNMLQMFLGNVSLADKLQPELIKFLSSEGTSDILETLLHKEWDKFSEWNFGKIEDWLEKDKMISTIKQYSHQVIHLDELMDQPVGSLVANYKETIIEKFVPNIVGLLTEWLIDRIGTVLEKLHLAQIVSDQVETFPVERLEEMVLSITSSELKMITYLGALLGGIIGFFQGLIAVLI